MAIDLNPLLNANDQDPNKCRSNQQHREDHAFIAPTFQPWRSRNGAAQSNAAENNAGIGKSSHLQSRNQADRANQYKACEPCAENRAEAVRRIETGGPSARIVGLLV